MRSAAYGCGWLLSIGTPWSKEDGPRLLPVFVMFVSTLFAAFNRRMIPQLGPSDWARHSHLCSCLLRGFFPAALPLISRHFLPRDHITPVYSEKKYGWFLKQNASVVAAAVEILFVMITSFGGSGAAFASSWMCVLVRHHGGVDAGGAGWDSRGTAVPHSLPPS